jgi:hypothetical protein
MSQTLINPLPAKRRMGAILVFVAVYVGALVIIFAPQGSFSSKTVAVQTSAIVN